MFKPSRATADANLKFKKQQEKQVQKEKDKERVERRERMARLKALRLAQEQGASDQSEP